MSALDACLFYYWIDGSIVLILIYVDDILIAAKDQSIIDELKDNFMKRFKCKDLGVVTRFLGVWVEYDRETLFLHQNTYTKEIVERFLHLTRSFYKTPKKLPLPANVQELLMDEIEPKEGTVHYDWWKDFPYLSLIGSALYLAINTRPDIIFAICLLARYSIKKTFNACKALVHVYSYLEGTINEGIRYKRNPGPS